MDETHIQRETISRRTNENFSRPPTPQIRNPIPLALAAVPLERRYAMKLNDNLIPGVFFGALFLMCSVPVALAQYANKDEYPKVEILAGYSALGEAGSRGISFGPNRSVVANYSAEPGFETSIIRNFSKHFGIKGDFSAHFNNESASGPIT